MTERKYPKNVVHYVTRQYMKQNRRRTLSMFLGVTLMVMLMTCVFVGKDTALGFLESSASAEKGKWHVNLYDLTAEECNEISGLSWVKQTARSESLGATEFPESANSSRPYLNVKAYEAANFDWMNITVTEGRLPENDHEIVINEAARDDGASMAVGDKISARFFERKITGLSKETIFPFYSLSVKEGETISVPQDFPYYGENDSFQETHSFTGLETNYTVVGFIKTPFYESASGAGYTSLTLLSEPTGNTCNLSLQLNTRQVPQDYVQQLRNLADGRDIEFNNEVLIFSGESGNSTFNLMVNAAVGFFVVLIAAASVVLIYNLFNLSFRERSVYLGMLASVGATGKQKRSSVYCEAFTLLLPALPVGILAGFGVILAGMKALMPHLLKAFYGYETAGQISLTLNGRAVALTVLLSAATVLLSAFLPARKAARIGAIDSIRGNFGRQKKSAATVRRLGKTGACGLLARRFLSRESRKSGSIRRAASVFLLILLVTASVTEMLNEVVAKKTDGSGYSTGTISDETGCLYCQTDVEGYQAYQELAKEIQTDPQTLETVQWQTATWLLQVDNSVYSQEYWTAYKDIFNQYYHRKLSDEEFQEIISYSSCFLSVVSVEDKVLKEIAEKLGLDFSTLTDESQPGAIVIQNGHLSTDNIIANGDTPDRYRYYDLKKMTDLQVGDTISTKVYSKEINGMTDFPLTIAELADNESLDGYFQTDDQCLWILVSDATIAKIRDIQGDEASASNISPELHIRLKDDGGSLLTQLKSLDGTQNQNLFFAESGTYKYAETLRLALGSSIRILSVCFVLLVSLLCLLNLYNSISGRMEGRRRELAVLRSVGMTGAQLKKTLLLESVMTAAKSLCIGTVLSSMLVYGIRQALISLFGYLKLTVPVVWFLLAALFTFGMVAAITLAAYRRIKTENLLEDIRRESI